MYFSAARLSLALSLVSSLPVLKAQQNGGGDSSSFLNNYLTFLNGSGYTSLSSALQQANSTDGGRQWIGQLSSGEWTVFAPSNQAFQSANSSLIHDSDALSSYLSYHFVFGNVFSSVGGGGGSSPTGSSTSTSTQTQSSSAQTSGTGSSTTSSPSVAASAYRLSNLFSSPHFLQSTNGGSGNSSAVGSVSIGRTLLSNDDFVSLEGPDGDERRHQVLAWVAESGQVTVLNLPMNVTVGNTTSWNNLHVANIDHILIPPGNLSSTLVAVNDTQLLNLLTTAQLPSDDDNDDGGNSTAIDVLEDLRGFTFFVPNADAFTSEFNDSLSGYRSNQGQLTTLTQNHFINGSTVYSPVLIQHAQGGGDQSDGGYGGALISAAGEGFTISQNDTGLFVSNGNGSSAQIVQSDVLVENGVVHLIDHFLINEASDPSAADSAFSSASSAATETSTDTSILSAAATGSATSSASQSSSASSTHSQTETQTQTTTSGASTSSGFRFARFIIG